MSYRFIIILSGLLLAFIAGWWINEWRRDSMALAVEKAASELMVQNQTLAAQSARQLEDTLQEILRHERQSETIIRTEIIKPIFTQVCATDEFVSLFNNATAALEHALSRDNVNAVPN